MAHTYSVAKSWVDKGRPGVHCGYVNITLVDDYAAGGFAIDAEDVNPNCSTLYQLTVLNQHTFMLDATVKCVLSWDYANQKIFAVEITDGSAQVELSDADALAGSVIYAYYEGS